MNESPTSIFVEEVVLFARLVFIGDYRFQVYVFHAFENVVDDFRVVFCDVRDNLLNFFPFGTGFGILCQARFRRAGVGELARALNKIKVVIVPPFFDIVLADKIQRTDKFHSLEVV